MMKYSQYILIPKHQLIVYSVVLTLLIFNNFKVNAQTARVTQDLDFGTVANTGTGGTITISNTGTLSPSSTGGITSVSSDYLPGIIHVTFGGYNHVIISYTNISVLKRTGNNKQLTIVPNPVPNKDKATSNPMDIMFGGKLTIDNSTTDPPGDYNGTFNIKCTFIY